MTNIIMLLFTFIGALLGIYAQDISYFLYYNFGLSLTISIVSFTILSLLLFILPYIWLSKKIKEGAYKKSNYRIYTLINGFLGIIVSSFSLMVLLFWLS